ncbi:MAG: ABC transporter ATP-binding protein [Oligoflexia bacterium]|nr:ABC transporter ATP-binding protein [Oligoflexia bacterium]MBF0365584.1 ABC transporter ATP-binding protein [Oligoflexia bacterium]
MLEVRSLSVYFGDFAAVKKVSFKVSKGEIFGLLGANGAGKTTTIRVMCGLLIPTEGEVQIGDTIFGKNNNGNNNNSAELIKSRIGYMSQKFTLYDDLTVEENWKFAASLRNMNNGIYKKRCDYLNQWLSLGDRTKQLVGKLPSGLKQQVALAAALFHNPDIIFLDEPTAGVSPYARMQFWNLIKILASEGKTIIVTTHYMDEAENCERLSLMRAGEIIALDSPEKLKHSTFPHGIWGLAEEKIPPCLREEKTLSMWPCGLNYHMVTHNLAHWEDLKKQHPILANATLVAPTLEDVFLELVEGRSR